MSSTDKAKLDGIASGDLSDVCKFNFVKSISECKSDRINFFLRCPDTHIDLSPFDSYPDGTILLITVINGATIINHRSGKWYNNGEEKDETGADYTYCSETNLITKNNGIVHHYKLD